jgi:hypothetical protein
MLYRLMIVLKNLFNNYPILKNNKLVNTNLKEQIMITKTRDY